MGSYSPQYSLEEFEQRSQETITTLHLLCKLQYGAVL